MNKVIIILGTARSNGNTTKLVEKISAGQIEIVDLNTKKIQAYNYDHEYEPDDFLDIVEKMIQADVIVFATPVYWFSMSAVLKTFFDRFSDLVRIRKDLGRKLAGRKVFLASTSSSRKLAEGFELPFIATADYLNMEYKGNIHVAAWDDGFADDIENEVNEFRCSILDEQPKYN
jgi:multimeric flavodoxin WrbA